MCHFFFSLSWINKYFFLNSYRNVYTRASFLIERNPRLKWQSIMPVLILHELADGAPSSIVSNEFLLCIRAVSFVPRLSIDIVSCYYRLRGV